MFQKKCKSYHLSVPSVWSAHYNHPLDAPGRLPSTYCARHRPSLLAIISSKFTSFFSFFRFICSSKRIDEVAHTRRNLFFFKKKLLFPSKISNVNMIFIIILFQFCILCWLLTPVNITTRIENHRCMREQDVCRS